MNSATTKAAALAVLLATAVFSATSPARDYYVSPKGRDTNTGATTSPFKTVQKALTSAAAGDAIHISAGRYDLAGFSKNLDQPLTIIGAGKNATILTRSGALTVSAGLTVKSLKFLGPGGAPICLVPAKGQTVDPLIIQDCAFERLSGAIRTKKRIQGAVTNVDISRCDFLNMNGSGVLVIGIFSGLISNVKITGNTFKDIVSSRKGCSAIVIGSNATRATTKNALIANNTIDKIHGPTRVVKGAGPEVHGILAYGTNLRILKNTVRDLNAGRDHEAIYMKARDSVIADNVVENCGSGGGGADICSKGGKLSEGNVISGNKITGDLPGRCILAVGGSVIKNNYIKKTNGFNGIDVYAYGKPVEITGNHVETKSGSAIRLDHGKNAVITDNVIICYEGRTLGLHHSTGTALKNNKERKGRK